ncbi:NAD(P)-binding protein [bacterium]
MKKIGIIGAGISGLCAGSYLQMNGYETEIFELNNLRDARGEIHG